MSRLTRTLLIFAAILVALAAGIAIGQRMNRPAPDAEPLVVETPEPAAQVPEVMETAPPPPPPAPKAAAITEQDEAAQVAEDAAAVGMTTLDPEPEASAPNESDPAPEPPQAEPPG